MMKSSGKKWVFSLFAFALGLVLAQPTLVHADEIAESMTEDVIDAVTDEGVDDMNPDDAAAGSKRLIIDFEANEKLVTGETVDHGKGKVKIEVRAYELGSMPLVYSSETTTNPSGELQWHTGFFIDKRYEVTVIFKSLGGTELHRMKVDVTVTEDSVDADYLLKHPQGSWGDSTIEAEAW